MRKIFTFLVILSLIVGKVSFAQKDIKLKTTDREKIEITKNRSEGFRITNSILKLNFDLQETEKGNFETLSVNGLTKTFNEGNPNLPVVSKLIEIPLDAEVRVKVVSYDEEIIYLKEHDISNKLFPAQASIEKNIDPSTVPLKINEKVYNTDAFFKQEIATVEDRGILRYKRFGYLQISPIQYNPVKNIIKVLNNIVVDIEFVGANPLKNKTYKKKYYSPYFNGVANGTINHIYDSKELIESEPVKYVIVADRMFEATLQPFIEWKTKKGFNVVEAYTDEPAVGNTTSTIKTYLQDLYNNPSDGIAPSFVLFVGDIDQIPAYSGSETVESHVSDLYYCEYTGDKLPEVYYGRFSAENTSELQNQIDKTLEIEKYEMPDPSYLDNVVLVAGVDDTWAPTHGNGAINYANDNYTNASNGINSMYYLYGDDSGVMASDASGASASIISNISAGVSLANYTAHCSSNGWANPSFSISDIAGMNNEHMYPLLIGNCCLSNKFDDNDCFGEEIVYAQNEGAVAYIGGSNSTYWDEDYWWGVGLTSTVTANPTYAGSGLGTYDCAFHTNGEVEADWFVTASQMIVAGNLAVEASSSTRKTYYWEIYHLMGDPSLTPYITVPTAVTASYNSDIIIGANTFTVNTEENAYVAFSKDGVLLDAKIADASGTVVLNFTALEDVGTADVVITKQNRAPKISTVNIIPSTTPYITLDSYVIDDASGNVNGLADFAETLNLDVTLKNVSDTYDALNVETTLSTSDANVSISDATETYGTIAASGSLAKVGAYNISINNDVEDQHVLNFDLTITGEDASTNSYTWNSNINLTVNAPVLEIGDMTIDDSATGNNDGILDPGETATVNVVTTNSGHADITNVVGVLTIEGGSSPYLTIDNGTTSAYPLVIDEEGIASFEVTADAGTPVGTPVDMDINLTGGTSNQYSDMNGKVIIIGEIPEYTIDQEGTVSTCVGLFYDSGSSTEEYSNSENYTMTFESATVGKNIQANFINFDVESNATCNYDKLSIYNGTSSSADLIGEYCGTTSPGVVTASNSDGALTFVFTSDGSVTKSGWEAEISCVDAYDVTFVVSDVYGFVNGATVSFNGEEKSTNASGEAVFTNIIEGDNLPYIISALGHEEYSSNLNLLGDITETVDLVLSTYDITFNVFDEDGTTPLDGDVTFNGSTLSTTNGTVTFVSVPYELGKSYSVDVPLYEPYNGSIDVDAEKSEDVTMTLITWDVTFVVDDGTDPIVGAIIEFNGEELATEASGEVIFTHVPPGPKGDFPYTVRKSGYGNESGIVSVTNSNVTVPVTMTVGTATYKVSFNVTDGVNPIEGANVNFNSEDVLTNSEGYAEFLEVSEGTDLTYTVSKIAYFNSTGTVDVAGANVSEDVLLTIIPYDVTFIVTDGTNPIEGASINFHGETLTSNASGECVFVDIDPEATLTYIITKLGFDDVSSSLDVVDQDVTENVTMNVSTYDITFDVREDKGATLNADVSFNGTTQTCVNGLTTFTDVEYGLAQEYSVETDGYESITDAVDVNANKTVNVRMLIITYDITFAVTAEDGTTPVEAEVSFNGITQTATEGTTIFTGIEYELAKSFTMSAEGFYDTTATIDVDANKTIEVSMNHICYSVSFNVEDVDDNALEGVNVSFNSTNQLTDSEGSTTFTDVIPGDGLSYTLTKDGYNDITSSLNLTNSNVSLNITMTSSVGIESLSDLGISIYPNPSNGVFNVDLQSKMLGNIDLKIYNVNGQIVYSKSISNTKKNYIDIREQASGIYYLVIKSEKGVFNTKVVLE